MATAKLYRKLALWIAKEPSAILRSKLAVDLGTILADENPRFNWDIWFAACDVRVEGA